MASPKDFAEKVGLELIKVAPKLIEEGRKVYESVRDRPRPQTPQVPAKSVTLLTLRSTVADLQEHLEAIEAHEESQAELIARMTRFQAAILRWLFWLALFSVATGALALAALLVAVLR